MGDELHVAASAVPCDHETADATPVQERAPQLTCTDPSRTTLPRHPAAPARPEQNHTASRRDPEPAAAAEAAEHSQTSPKENDARIDDEPLHHETDKARASMTTTRKPAPGPPTTRVIERARERDAITETHFRSDLSGWMGMLACCWPLSCHLTQRQYRAPPACSQSPQRSPDSRRQH